MTKEIKLTQGQVAIVDDWWYEELSKYDWSATRNKGTFYAIRAIILEGKRTTIQMHRIIMSTPKGMHTDHINHNTLDNREENLRVCTSSENHRNRTKQVNNTSGYKGVSRDKKKWRATIEVEGKQKCYGGFSTPEEAAKMYDFHARRLHGKFSNVNFPE